MAVTEHGFVAMEAKTIKAILAWIRSGTAPGEVSERGNCAPRCRNVRPCGSIHSAVELP
jgi:hypothetical protein